MYPGLSMNVIDTTLRWVRRKCLFVHDAPDGSLELRMARLEIGFTWAQRITHQCQDKAHLSFQDPQPF